MPLLPANGLMQSPSTVPQYGLFRPVAQFIPGTWFTRSILTGNIIYGLRSYLFTFPNAVTGGDAPTTSAPSSRPGAAGTQ